MHFYRVDRLQRGTPDTAEQAFNAYAQKPGGGKAIYRADIRTQPRATVCTAHVFHQIPGQNRIFMGWYSQGTQVIDFVERADGSVRATEAGWFLPANTNEWVSAIFRMRRNANGSYTYWGATGDFNLGEAGRDSIDVYRVTLPPPPPAGQSGVGGGNGGSGDAARALRPADLGRRTNDRLLGSIGGDRIVGRRGNDRIKGRAGADCIRGQRGNDRLEGNAGADLVVGGPGADVAPRAQGPRPADRPQPPARPALRRRGARPDRRSRRRPRRRQLRQRAVTSPSSAATTWSAAARAVRRPRRR